MPWKESSITQRREFVAFATAELEWHSRCGGKPPFLTARRSLELFLCFFEPLSQFSADSLRRNL
jgi:hypothetical protein